MASLAKENMNDYLTISSDAALAAVELMKFYVDTKKLLYGFPLITIPQSQDMNVGPSISQQNNSADQRSDSNVDFTSSLNVDVSRRSVVSQYKGFSGLVSSYSTDPLDGSTIDAIIRKILQYKKQTITSSRPAQILRVNVLSIPFMMIKYLFD